MNKVFLKRQTNYDATEIERVVEQGLVSLDPPGENQIIKEGTTVFLKVNLLMKRKPHEATTTHPAIVEGAARALIARGAVVTIGDSPAGQYSVSALKGIYDVCGMADAAKNSGATLNYDVTAVNLKHENGKNYDIISPVLNNDVVISLCKLKTHGMVTFTGGVKNMFGCVPGLIKAEYHFKYPTKADFCSALVDICDLSRVKFCIMDGIMAMEGDGPSGGNPRKVDALLMSKNPHAIDMVATNIINLKKEDVPTLLEGIKRGSCPQSVDDIEIIGDSVESFFIKNFKHPRSKVITFVGVLPAFIRNPLFDVLTPRPIINTQKCIGCRECFKACPAKTIVMEEKKARIIKSGCIKCYCCHELCPHKAVDVKKTLFRRITR